MKNLYLLPTYKPSRLCFRHYYFINKDNIGTYSNVDFKNIYITSDEEIKDGDWCIDTVDNIIFKVKEQAHSGLLRSGTYSYVEDFCKKIILTIDQDLIKDDVQIIDDEFLEWFVKNPSCEEVEVEQILDACDTTTESWTKYKIIIQKEEPKDVVLGYKTSLDAQMLDKIGLEEPKQETLEEAAERLIFKTIGGNYGIMSSDENDQVDGYYNTYEEAYLTLKLKWQAERMYSEFDLDAEITKLNTPDRYDNVKQKYNYSESDIVNLFEQHKKKS